ncbi:hypothetical protein GXM_07311 [Nostoc sphaeroides CCNUC1]|uniref:Uncharacterized protein n=1 Tax=Nostoc sphaeroides CCNUC1 TaxID=2653204 RepID=A0A5P8WAJ0_9NOSO|nr:hypothetical protein GXM_07311 [Nostoc sphaeroides CCNUC1]
MGWEYCDRCTRSGMRLRLTVAYFLHPVSRRLILSMGKMAMFEECE